MNQSQQQIMQALIQTWFTNYAARRNIAVLMTKAAVEERDITQGEIDTIHAENDRRQMEWDKGEHGRIDAPEAAKANEQMRKQQRAADTPA